MAIPRGLIHLRHLNRAFKICKFPVYTFPFCRPTSSFRLKVREVLLALTESCLVERRLFDFATFDTVEELIDLEQ
jgi:hypothetical protein